MSANPHQPRALESSIDCAAPMCGYVIYVGSASMARAHALRPADPAAAYKTIWSGHSRQFEDDGAPDISVEWEILASCSVCPDGGDIETGDDATVICQNCRTSWDMDGTGGFIDPDELDTIRDQDHEDALNEATK